MKYCRNFAVYFVVLCLFVQGCICMPHIKEIDKDNQIKHGPKDNNKKMQETEFRQRRDIRITERGKDEGYLFDNPQKINPESDLEVILDSFVIEDNGKEHKAVGVRRKPNYGDSHDHYIKVPRTGGRKRNFLSDETELWPDKEIPYEIDTSGYSKEDIAIIEKAIEEFHDLTCLRWIPIESLEKQTSTENQASSENQTSSESENPTSSDMSENQNLSENQISSENQTSFENQTYYEDQYYVKIVTKDGCWSSLGLAAPFLDTKPYQELSLEVPGCMTVGTVVHEMLQTLQVGTVVHEMLHAAGAQHEQCRTDRDKYLDIMWSNIEKSNSFNFDLDNYTINYHPYDVQSIMQYGLRSYSTNGRRSMHLKDWRLEFLPNSVDGLTFYDVMGVTTSYHCNDSCPDMNCQNAGFVNWKCKCYCPKDLGGETCTETISVGDCGGTIRVGKDKEVFIQNPNYPANYTSGLKCTWLIEGVPENILRGTIVDMDISNNNLACYHWLEIRYNLLGQSGPRRCGKTNYEVWDTSKDELKNKMIVQFDSVTGSDKPTSRGFKMKFESIGTGCINHPCVFGECYSPLNTDKYTCTCDNGFTGTKCDTPSAEASIGCTAEVGEFCMLSQSTDDDFDWEFQTEKGVWGEDGSGPYNAYEGCVYFYVGDVFQKKEGSTAVMSTTLSLPAVDRCLAFRYFMNGDDKGALNIYTENIQGEKDLVFADCSDHGRNWIEAKVNIPATEGLKVIFEARVGTYIYTLNHTDLYYTDVALDDIWLMPGFCDLTDYSNPSDNLNGTFNKCKACGYDGYQYVWEIDLCIRFVSDRMTWNDSKLSCEEEEGQLFAPENAEKESIILDMLAEEYERTAINFWWIGGSDIEEEGNFKWLNGQPLTYSNWYPKQPDDFTASIEGADCVSYYAPRSKWADRNCNMVQNSICESRAFV